MLFHGSVIKVYVAVDVAVDNVAVTTSYIVAIIVVRIIVCWLLLNNSFASPSCTALSETSTSAMAAASAHVDGAVVVVSISSAITVNDVSISFDIFPISKLVFTSMYLCPGRLRVCRNLLHFSLFINVIVSKIIFNIEGTSFRIKP